QTKKIATLLSDFLASRGVQLIDLKLEFGKAPDGRIVLMDEISPGSMRVYLDGKKMEPNQLAELILKD
ncbi:MAG: phosphoribosylaminoimidazolesuccinocarboxamide synthase, partial [Chloroflexi bacterium]|nr:phosphoribosylaminoimidazolesuccinocarboxamide synthase [Chloroflexota bacterium]